MEFQVPRMGERESAAWRGLIAVAQLLPVALDTQLQRDAGMTHFEFTVLTALRLAPDATLRMTALAEFTSSTLARLSNVCSRLEARGLIERFPCPHDRRVTNVRLTTTGRRDLVRAVPEHIALVREVVVDALSPEQLDALTDITTTITNRLSARKESAAETSASEQPRTRGSSPAPAPAPAPS